MCLRTRLPSSRGAVQASQGIYRLSPALYREADLEPLSVSPEEAILAYVETHGRITRREAVALTGLGEGQARYHLRKLTEQGRLELVGAGRGAYYRLPKAEENGEFPIYFPIQGLPRECEDYQDTPPTHYMGRLSFWEHTLKHRQVSDFTAYLRLKNLSPRTIEEYQKVLGSLFKYLKLGDSSPGEITVPQLRDYVASMQQRGLAAKTVSNHVLVIKRFFGFLLAEEYIQEDPSRRLPRPKVGKRLPKALTIPQVQALFAAMGSESRAGRRDRVLFQLTYAGGLRVGEAVGLKAADIDFTQGTLMVVGKGDKERRIYLKPFVLKQLQRYITGNGLVGYLFPGRGDSHITARNAQMRLKKYARKAGLPEHVSPHSLRHSTSPSIT
jgi:integrase/recombinase XerD